VNERITLPSRRRPLRQWRRRRLLGGLVALRPDHDRYLHATRDAITERRYTVVVQALSAEQRDRAAENLAARGAEVRSTL
jgi:hypothetical protein